MISGAPGEWLALQLHCCREMVQPEEQDEDDDEEE